MTEIIEKLIHSDIYIIIYGIMAVINALLIIFFTIYVGRFNFIKKMDQYFNIEDCNYGLWFNSQRAFSYGMSFLFPNTLGKRVHKHIDLYNIPDNEKRAYKIFTIIILLSAHIFFVPIIIG